MAEARAQQPPWAWREFADVQLGDARLRQRLVELSTTFAVYAVVAWRVLHVDLAARVYPQEPCTTFLTEDEWKALCCHHSKRRDRS